MRKKRVLITGGSGFLGRNLINFIKNDYNLYSVSRTTKVGGAENIIEDLTGSDLGFISKIKPDFVVWLATVSSPKEAEKFPQKCFETNVLAIQKYLAYACITKPKKIVLLSSAVIYKDKEKGLYKEGDEINKYSGIYNYSKYLMETLAHYYRINHNLDITVFRLSNTYGPYQTLDKIPYLVPTLFNKARSQKEVSVWNSQPVRDWVFVEDVAEAIKKEFTVKDSGIYNLGTGVGTSVGELSRAVAAIYGKSVKDLKKAVGPPYRIVLDTKQLNKHLNFVPKTSVKEGVQKTHQFYNND